MYYLYLIECSDKTFYLGVTNDLTRRFQEHQDGLNISCYTFNRRPLILKYYKEFYKMSEAIYYEKKLKKWSKVKKEAFFAKQWERLHELAKCRNASKSENFK